MVSVGIGEWAAPHGVRAEKAPVATASETVVDERPGGAVARAS